VSSGPDSFLLLFQKSLRSHDVKKILGYLRNFGILDGADCERVSSETISDHMVTELVTMIHTKDPHAFWYFVHSLKTNALFKFFHGEIHCCVCEEVQAKEKEIEETLDLRPVPLPEGGGTIFAFTVVTRAEITQCFKNLKNSAMEGNLARELKRKLQRRSRELQNRLDAPDPASKLKGQALGRSNSLGNIENLKKKSFKPSPLIGETQQGKSRTR